jgi:hypothetical protein
MSEETLTVQAVVEREIATLGIKAELEALNKEALEIKVLSVDDAQGYEAAKGKLNEVIKTRTGIDKTRKSIKDPYLQAGKDIDSAAKVLAAIIEPAEDHLKAQVKKVDDHKAEQERLKEEARLKKIADRKALIRTYSPTATADGFACGPVSITEREIEAMTDGDFSARTKMMSMESERIAKEAAETEAKLKRLAELEAKEKAAEQKSIPDAVNTDFDPFGPDKAQAPTSKQAAPPPALTNRAEPAPYQRKLRLILLDLKTYGFKCEAGALENSAPYRDLVELAGLA